MSGTADRTASMCAPVGSCSSQGVMARGTCSLPKSAVAHPAPANASGKVGTGRIG